jgi:hypothetical protein
VLGSNVKNAEAWTGCEGEVVHVGVEASPVNCPGNAGGGIDEEFAVSDLAGSRLKV